MGNSRSSGRSAVKGSRRFGSEVPRVFTPPLRRLTPKTSLGFALIEFAAEVLGIELLPWQRWLAVHALELLPDGTFRFRTVVLLVARQNGKSTFLQILALFFLYVRGVSLVIGTAQNLDIAEEVWQGAVDIAEDVPELAAEIANVNKTNGKKALELHRNRRYKVQAANRRGGRGLSGDLVLMDELREHQSWAAWGAVTKTTLARAFAQVWAASNAGDAASIVLAFLRRAAHSVLGDPDGLGAGVVEDDTPAEVEADEDSLGIFEWSAPPGCGLDDRDGWAMANPSLGYTITERAIASARRTDPEPVFRTEVLCQWVDGLIESVIPEPDWRACVDPTSGVDSRPVFAIDVSPNQSWAAIGVSGKAASGDLHVEVTSTGGVMDHRPGTGWIVARAAEISGRWSGARFKVAAGSAAESLLPELKAAGVRVDVVSARDVPAACGFFYRAAVTHSLKHLGQTALDGALTGAVRRDVGDGAWVWARRKSTTDITPLYAVTLAAWAASQVRPLATVF